MPSSTTENGYRQDRVCRSKDVVDARSARLCGQICEGPHDQESNEIADLPVGGSYMPMLAE